MSVTTKLMTIKEVLSASNEDLYEVLSQDQILALSHTLGTYFGIDSLTEVQSQSGFYNNVCIIELRRGQYALINREGHLIGNRCYSNIRYLNDHCILVEEYSDGDGDQFIYDYKGEVIFEGYLGDLSRVTYNSGYLFLVGRMFSSEETWRIESYRRWGHWFCFQIVCPACGKMAHWHDDSGLYICKRCKREFEPGQSFMLSNVQMETADYYEDLLASEPEVLDDEARYYDEFMSPWHPELDVPEEDYMGDMFALFSIMKRKVIIPFQPCMIKYCESYYHGEGIYLENSIRRRDYMYGPHDKVQKYYSMGVPDHHDELWNHDIKFSRRISAKHYSGIDAGYIEGNVFISIFDTFRSGAFIGKTLSMVFKHHYKRLFRMVYNSDIYITTEALMQLYQKYYSQHPSKVKALISIRDCQFQFEPVSSMNDNLSVAKRGSYMYYDKDNNYRRTHDWPVFSNLSFDELLQYHPVYISTLIRHNALTLNESVISQLDEEAPYYDVIMEALAEQEEEEAERQRLDYQHYCEQLEASYNYEEDTYYALGGDDYQRFKENGGSIDEMMDSMGL